MEAEQPIEETKLCDLCGQQIPVSKFRMHEMGCARQNYKCKECNQCVAKCDREEHEEEEHKEVKCEQCGFIARNYVFKGHYLSCSQKPQQCKFCDKEISFYDIKEHFNICGGKTQKCADCGTYVKNAELRDHKQDGFCEVIAEQKREQAEIESKKALEEYQKKYLAQIQKDGPMAYEAPPQTAPNVPSQVIQPRTMPANPQPEAQSAFVPLPQPGADGNLDDYDQMIFNQFQADDDEAFAKQLQEGGSMGMGGGDGGGGAGGFDQPDLGVRKADSIQNQQLIGGDDDYPSPAQYGQYSMPQGFSMGGVIGGNFNHAPQQMNMGGVIGNNNSNNYGDGVNEMGGHLPQGIQHQESEDEIQKAIQASLEAAQNNDIPMTEDEELAKAIAASMANQ